MTSTRDIGIAVIGGGPAGLAAADVLADAGRPVTIYDRMPSLGRKLLMAGRGGLNLTHSEPLTAFLERYAPDEPKLRTAITEHPPEALRAWCETLGEPTFVGSSGRVFPKSFKASPLLRAWLGRLVSRGVVVRTRHRLVGLSEDALTFETPDGPMQARPAATLLALGGASWPRLGSDGAWVRLAEETGIDVAPLKPANVGASLAWSDHFGSRYAGTPLKRTGFTLGATQVIGEAMITRDGLEGGAIYALSRHIREGLEARGEVVITLDLRPDLDEAALALRLGRRKAGDSLSTHLRKAGGLSPVASGLLREAHGLTLPEPADQLAACIKRSPLWVHATGTLDRAISTAGGIRFDTLDTHFMLRARPGLFAAGEMLDWEAPTGGYLLQAAFASGRKAGNGMLAWLNRHQAD